MAKIIKTMYPYPFKVIQVKVKSAWMLHAEEHAQAEMKRKETASISSWDVCQRLGEIAFGVKYGLLSDYPEVGKRCPPFLFVSDRVIVHTSPFDERYKGGNEAALKVMKRFAKHGSIHVLGSYDPPFVDLIGWETLAEVMDATEVKGRTFIPVGALRPMTELPKYVAL